MATKIVEHVAHNGCVRCLAIGRKSATLMATGGDDHVVNLWSIGQTAPVMSFVGHCTPVECVAFDGMETHVIAGSQGGTLKLWDVEGGTKNGGGKTFSGHQSNCTVIDVHPHGDFFASGSMDTTLKVWDMRRRTCVSTYKVSLIVVEPACLVWTPARPIVP